MIEEKNSEHHEIKIRIKLFTISVSLKFVTISIFFKTYKIKKNIIHV